MGIPFLPFGFGDCQTLLLQGSCLVFVLSGIWPFEPFHVDGVLVMFLLELCFLYLLRSPFAARPLTLLEGVRVALGRLPLSMVCPCFRCCFVCLLVGRLFLSFSGVQCFVSCCLCFCSRCLC